MSVLAALEGITDERAFELSRQIAAATTALMNAKRRKAAADAAIANAEAERNAAALELTAAQNAMQSLRVALAGELTIPE